MAQRLTWIVWGSLMNRGAGRLSARLASSREMPWPNEQRPDKGPKNVRLVGSSSGAREISEATRQRQDLKSKDSGLARSGRRAGIIKHGKDEKSRVPVTEGEGVAESKTIWEDYKRNFKGGLPPKRGPEKIVNNPCPICSRDILIKYTDTTLLEQFISPYTGEILEASRTGLCRQQQKKMVNAIEKAWDCGVLPYPIPRKMTEEGFRIPPWNKIDVV